MTGRNASNSQIKQTNLEELFKSTEIFCPSLLEYRLHSPEVELNEIFELNILNI